MSKAPREIWAFLDGAFVGMFVSGGITEGGTHYIRADIAKAELDAAVRAEREAIANGIEAKIGQHVHPQSLTADVLRDLAAAIRERGK